MGAKEKQTFGLDSKFWRTFLTSLAAVLIFAGPTYIVLVLVRILDLDYMLSMTVGLVLFLLGFGLLSFLIRKTIVS
ncbi:MAG: hypothetical protein QW791_00060 [Candidatus Bathyarchaeia archaeon]